MRSRAEGWKMDDAQRPVIAITMGDPCGIGPEVIARALASGEVYPTCRPLVVGSAWCMEQGVKLAGAGLGVQEVDSPAEAGLSPDRVDVVDIHNLSPEDVTVGKVSLVCGKAAMEWVARAAELALAGQVQALATAPINKEAASLAGYKAIGHMELLQEISGAPEVATMLMSGRLWVVHLTTHRSLRRACDYVTRDGILAKLELTQNSFVPLDSSLPVAANAEAPSVTMSSTLTSVSTLFTAVGFPNSPSCVGKGGLLRGSPR